MTIKTSFKEGISELVGYAASAAWTITKLAAGTFIFYNLSSHNGCMDSQRTIAAKNAHDANNIAKVVMNVGETWKDNELSLYGSNPQVIRTVTFDDSSKTILTYRTLAHQPFVRWMAGDEFNPKVGERYEVADNNYLVQKIE